MEYLLDNLLDLSVAALVSPGMTPRAGQTLAAATPEMMPASFRSPFDQPGMYAHAGAARATGSPQEVVA